MNNILAWFFVVIGCIGNIILKYFPEWFLEFQSSVNHTTYQIDTYATGYLIMICTGIILLAITDNKDK